MKKALTIVGIVAIVAILSFVSFRIGQKHCVNGPIIETKTKTDTLYIYDTITRIQPKYVTTRTVDTMLVAVTDTVMLRDTVYLVIDREQRHYSDSLYDAWVSGYRPALDSVRIYPRHQVVTIETVRTVAKPSHWGIGITAGYGVGVSSGRVITSPYIGLGMSYNLITW